VIRLRALTLAAAFVAGASSLSGSGGLAFAAGPPQITVQAGATQVEVGEPFTIVLRAMVEQGDAQPQGAELAPPRDFRVVGQSEGTQMVMDPRGVRVGLRAIWQLVGQRPGKFTIPSPTVEWNGRRLSGSSVTIEVVPATGRARRQQQQNSPFLMPGMPSIPGFNFSFPFQGIFRDEDTGPRTAPELALPTAPDPSCFLHVVADKNRVVVGQQVSVSLYVYWRDRGLNTVANHEPPLLDFLRMPLHPDVNADKAVIAMAGGTKYNAKFVDWLALFPRKAGDLHTGAWRWKFEMGRPPAPTERASEDLVIHVTEPPRAGRPVGYVVGNVGQFSLSAEVGPRRIEQGSEVAVSLRLSGTGNLPQSLRMPERTGIEWLEPEKKESIEPQGGIIGGSRTFNYVVRINESGTVDLGDVTLPYWDPAASQYKVATAFLGKIEVNSKPGPRDPATQEPLDQPPPDPFVSLPAARTALGAYVPPRPRLLDGRSMWMIIAAPPLVVGATYVGAGAARRVRSRREAAKGAPMALARRALAEAREAERGGDVKALTAALERAVHLAIEGATGLKSRGVLVSDLPAELAERGLSSELAEALGSTLAACEAVRFDPEPSGRQGRDLSTRVQAVVADLERLRHDGGSPPVPAEAP
jgi:hypothetical protein